MKGCTVASGPPPLSKTGAFCYNRRMKTACCALLVLLAGIAPRLCCSADTPTVPVTLPAPNAVVVPGGKAYLEPDAQPPGMDVSETNGVTGWGDSKIAVVWYGQFPQTGALTVAVTLRLPAGQQSRLRLTVAGQTHTAAVTGADPSPVTADFGTFRLARSGTQALRLQGVAHTGTGFGDVLGLTLGGPAGAAAQCSTFPSRGAPSVHLWYQTPPGMAVAAFDNQVTVRTDPLWSYYMVCGFSRGYFGIQVNSPTERRILFSVWNAGDEPTDPRKVPAADRVQLLAKGPGVIDGAFGNEGTGGHCSLVYPWKTGRTYDLRVTAQAQGDATVYSGYFFRPDQKRWMLIGSYRAPHDGGLLRGLYSFDEDFDPADGQQRRLADFGPTWVRPPDAPWHELTTVHFTCTQDGIADRLDRAAGVDGTRFFLATGGFRPAPQIRYGQSFTRPATNHPPADLPPSLTPP